MTDKTIEDRIIEAVWPYGKPDPISVVLSRGIDERIFQMPMSIFVKALTAQLNDLVLEKQIEARIDELKRLDQDSIHWVKLPDGKGRMNGKPAKLKSIQSEWVRDRIEELQALRRQ